MRVNILFIGDIMGRPGREMIEVHLPRLIARHDIHCTIANGENAAGRAGITPGVAEELWNAGVDVITLGDHAWDQKEILPAIDETDRLLRPANFPAAPGRGATVVETRQGVRVGVINLMGRVFLPVQLDCPFRAADRLLEEMRGTADVVVIDFHAEATSEKVALGWYLDGRVTAVLGSHTHVQTADERILTEGTAYISDAGMTGPADGVIGIDRERAIQRFLTQMPVQFAAAHGARQLNGVVVGVDLPPGRAVAIERVALREEGPSGTPDRRSARD